MRTNPERSDARPLTATEAALLGLLSRRPMSGYDLRRAVDRGVGYFWAPARSHIYAVLPRLVDSGLVTRRRVRQEKRPDKQVYRLTKEGRAALREWLASAPVDLDVSRNSLLLKLFFGELADLDDLIDAVRQQEAKAAELERALSEIDEAARGSEGDAFHAITREYGLAYARAVRRWAVEALRQLEARKQVAAG